MPQLANVVLTDRAATPVNHTFTPEDITSGVGSLVESTGVPVKDKRLTIALKKSNDRCKPEIRLVVPTTQTVTGSDGITREAVVRTAYATVSFNFANDSTPQERKDVVGMIQSALNAANAVPNGVIVDLTSVY
jgi:hypothetical protein